MLTFSKKRAVIPALVAAAAMLAMLASGPVVTSAQPGAPGTIATFAGGGAGDNVTAMDASFYDPYALKVTSNGDVYVLDDVDCRVRKISARAVTTVAGGAGCGFSGDNGPATLAQLNRPTDLVVDQAGSVFVADAYNCRVRKIQNGIITTAAGGGGCVDAGDGAQATQGGLAGALSLAIDADDRLYIATSCRIRLVDAGVITRIAGSDCGSTGDGGPAADAQVQPLFMAVDSAGTLYFSERGTSCRVRKVKDGIIDAVVGRPGRCSLTGVEGDGGPAIDANFQPWQLAVDGNGDLYVSDRGRCRIRKVDHTTAIIDTIVGSYCDFTPSPTPVLGVAFFMLRGFTVDRSGAVYAGEYSLSSSGVECAILKTEAGFIVTIAGAAPCGLSADGHAATETAIGYPARLRVGEDGDVYFVQGCAVRKVHENIVTTVAGQSGCASTWWGTSTTDGVLATTTLLRGAADLAVDGAGGFYVAEPCTIRYVASSGVISTVAGNTGCAGSAEGPAADVLLQSPFGLAVGPDGNLYFGVGCRVARLSGGFVTTVAGSATGCGYAGDGGPATAALLQGVMGVAFADDGSMTVLSGTYYTCTIRRIAASGGIKTLGSTGHCGAGFTVDHTGNVFYFDPTSCLVRELSGGAASFTVAGRQGTCPQVYGGLDASYGWLSGDGGLATNAALTGGDGLAIGPDGNLYIADNWNLRIRVVYEPNVDSDGDGYPDALERALGKDPATPCATMRADVDLDGRVSILDLAAVAVDFGQPTTAATTRHDQDGDHYISILDLARQAQRFGQYVTACP